jgi:trehalose 6-phosphate synthase/phosphatase
MPSTLINVSNRLPVTVEENRITKSSGGLVAALEGLPEGQYKTKWIGWPGAAFPEESRRKEIAAKLAEEYGCLAVFLGQEEATGFYEGFSNSSIWPLLHYLPNYLRYEPAWWEHYRNVNQIFAENVLEIAQEGDLVWVHDYQLMLLPAMLRAAAPKLKIGFFLHTPFPAYEIFRCHPRRRELVAGMLGANRIGFHAFGYLRHFCSTVQRLLDIETALGIAHRRRAGWIALSQLVEHRLIRLIHLDRAVYSRSPHLDLYALNSDLHALHPRRVPVDYIVCVEHVKNQRAYE